MPTKSILSSGNYDGMRKALYANPCKPAEDQALAPVNAVEPEDIVGSLGGSIDKTFEPALDAVMADNSVENAHPIDTRLGRFSGGDMGGGGK